MSLATVLHLGNHSCDALVMLHTAVDTCNELSVYHFILGNIYAVSEPCFLLSSRQGNTPLDFHCRAGVIMLMVCLLEAVQ